MIPAARATCEVEYDPAIGDQTSFQLRSGRFPSNHSDYTDPGRTRASSAVCDQIPEPVRPLARSQRIGVASSPLSKVLHRGEAGPATAYRFRSRSPPSGRPGHDTGARSTRRLGGHRRVWTALLGGTETLFRRHSGTTAPRHPARSRWRLGAVEQSPAADNPRQLVERCPLSTTCWNVVAEGDAQSSAAGSGATAPDCRREVSDRKCSAPNGAVECRHV